MMGFEWIGNDKLQQPRTVLLINEAIDNWKQSGNFDMNSIVNTFTKELVKTPNDKILNTLVGVSAADVNDFRKKYGIEGRNWRITPIQTSQATLFDIAHLADDYRIEPKILFNKADQLNSVLADIELHIGAKLEKFVPIYSEKSNLVHQVQSFMSKTQSAIKIGSFQNDVLSYVSAHLHNANVLYAQCEVVQPHVMQLAQYLAMAAKRVRGTLVAPLVAFSAIAAGWAALKVGHNKNASIDA